MKFYSELALEYGFLFKYRNWLHLPLSHRLSAMVKRVLTLSDEFCFEFLNLSELEFQSKTQSV